MILPTSDSAALLLLFLSFVCLGSWINTFKLAGYRWRFELYSVDFAIGALLLSVIAAFTLGTLGSDLAFSDRLLVAGRSAQAFVLTGGFLFNFGNMLLLAAVSLLGISGAFPIGIGSALIVSSLFSFTSNNVVLLLGGIVLLLAGVLVNIAACLVRDPAAAARTSPEGSGKIAPKNSASKNGAAKNSVRLPPKPANMKTARGIFVALLGGVMLGFFYPVASKGMIGELALGPYAGLLVFSIGILLSTILLDFYFLNIAIDGSPQSPKAYLRGKAAQHFLGFAGGALWAAGALAALLALVVPAVGMEHALRLIALVGSALLAVAWGALGWKELKAASDKAKLWSGLSAALFACGLVLIALGVNP